MWQLLGIFSTLVTRIAFDCVLCVCCDVVWSPCVISLHFIFLNFIVFGQWDQAQIKQSTLSIREIATCPQVWTGVDWHLISFAAHRCIRALKTVQTEHAAPQLYTTLHRRTCSSGSTPRITTHYTIHPRDKDPRWEGKAKIYPEFLSRLIQPWPRCTFDAPSQEIYLFIAK